MAVGSMAPTIDIWDVDLMNTLEPVMVLGNKKSQKKNKKVNIISAFLIASQINSKLVRIKFMKKVSETRFQIIDI